MADKSQPDAASLGRALKQLEALLEARTRENQTGEPEVSTDQNLPVLDDIIDPEADGSGEMTDFGSMTPAETSRPQITEAELARDALQRLSEQMEIELEVLVSMLKENMMNEFREKLASVLGIDPQQLESIENDDDNAAEA